MFDESESRKSQLTPELAALETQLASLTPATPRIDRDRLMFAAGRAAGMAGATSQDTQSWGGAIAVPQPPKPYPARRSTWFWPAATATMTAASLMLAAMLLWQNQSPEVAQHTAKPQAANEQPAIAMVPANEQLANKPDSLRWSPRTASGYLGMRHVALTHGVGALEPVTLTANGLDTSNGEPPRSQPATARELLDELLPTIGKRTSS